MRKCIKKLFSTFLVVALIMTMTVTAFAADSTPHTITVNNDAQGHTYSAYQIFKGDISDGKLVNIQWGNGVNGAELLAALKDGSDEYDACNSASDVAGVLSTYVNDSTGAKDFAEIAGSNLTGAVAGTSTQGATTDGITPYTIPVAGAGYYLVKNTGTVPNGNAMTGYILKVVGSNVEITAKDSIVTSEKKVKDIVDTDGTVTGWQDSADYDIGDNIPFQLNATLPANFESYKSYSLTFHDKADAALSVNTESIKVYVNGSEVENTDLYQIKTDNLCDNGCTFEVKIPNVKANGIGATNGSVISVEYTAKLTEAAVLGKPGNKNTVYVTYTNDMYSEGEGGRTNDDTVIVFTYQTVVNKVNENGNPLPGATFELQKKVGDKWITIGAATNDAGTVFTFKGLDDGQYKLVETNAPEGYNKINDIEFKVTADHEIESANPQLKGLTGNAENGRVTFAHPEGSNDLSTLETSVVNKQGVVLPTTGGIGTTIFYAIGALLVIGTAILFITRRRVNS